MLPPAMAMSHALTPDIGVLIVQNNMKLLPREMCTGVQRPDLALGSSFQGRISCFDVAGKTRVHPCRGIAKNSSSECIALLLSITSV